MMLRSLLTDSEPSNSRRERETAKDQLMNSGLERDDVQA